MIMNKEQAGKIDQLFKEVADKGLNRRQMIQRAAAMGISAYALTFAFLQKSQEAVAQGEDNPLGVDAAAPLSVVIFKGGYGDDYAINVNDNIYGALYPDAEITHVGTQRLMDEYQAQIVDGNPPDVMDNSGANMFDNVTLVRDGLLADLTDLMEAPAHGQDGVVFADSLMEGTQANGVYDGVQRVLLYVLSIYGLWYNKALFDEKGWEYPKTWDEMLELCQVMADDGQAAWTYQGQYPYYIRAVFDQLVFKSGGWDAQLKLDNLAEDAWTQPVVRTALEALAALDANGYVLGGTSGLNHTDSQQAWLDGEAAFIPCGGWLENEMAGKIPEGFEMTVMPVPSLTAEDALPFEAMQVSGGENFIVFEQGNNVQGGKEWLRLLFSQEGAAFFSEATKSLTVVKGSADELELGAAFQSSAVAVEAAGENVFISQWPSYYPDLNELIETNIAQVMTGDMSVDDFIEQAQAKTDETREDDSITKYEVAAPGASPEATPAS